MGKLQPVDDYQMVSPSRLANLTDRRIGIPGRALAAGRRLTGLRQSDLANQGGFSVSMLKVLEKEGVTHFLPFSKSLAAYIRVLDKHGVKLSISADEVTVQQRMN